jgi:Dna[CI] antecedent, DciA
VLKLSEAIGGWKPAGKAPKEPVVLLEAGWTEIVGSKVAANSHPSGIAHGTLTIVTRSSAWSHQLSFLGEHVLRAVQARLPGAGVARLRFRVGMLAARTGPVRSSRRAATLRAVPERAEPASPAEALARFRAGVERSSRARRAAGWRECAGCGALVAPGAERLCPTCDVAQGQERAAATARLLFEAPWLGYLGTAALVDGLQEEEYERIRTLLLSRWWGILLQARNHKQLSRDGRERLVASSYVLLRSKIAPEAIMPATVRNVLGDELHELLYEAPSHKGDAVRKNKQRT